MSIHLFSESEEPRAKHPSDDLPTLYELDMPFADENLHLILKPGLFVVDDENWVHEEIDTDLDLEALVASYADRPQEQLDRYLIKLFWKDINPCIDDPWIDWDDQNEYAETVFTAGSQDALDNLMRLFILTDPFLNGLDPERAADPNRDTYEGVRLIASAKDNEPRVYYGSEGLYWNSSYYASPRLEILASRALSLNHPRGWTWEYNDQAYNRESGHNLCPNTLDYPLSDYFPATPREIVVACQELKKWLISEDLDPDELLWPLEPVPVE